MEPYYLTSIETGAILLELPDRATAESVLQTIGPQGLPSFDADNSAKVFPKEDLVIKSKSELENG
jgi:hypothetical protein